MCNKNIFDISELWEDDVSKCNLLLVQQGEKMLD